jgi:hypothetical protein
MRSFVPYRYSFCFVVNKIHNACRLLTELIMLLFASGYSFITTRLADNLCSLSVLTFLIYYDLVRVICARYEKWTNHVEVCHCICPFVHIFISEITWQASKFRIEESELTLKVPWLFRSTVIENAYSYIIDETMLFFQHISFPTSTDVSEVVAASIIVHDGGGSKHLWNVGRRLPGYTIHQSTR